MSYCKIFIPKNKIFLILICYAFIYADIPQASNALGISYINAYMKNNDFSISSQGISLQYGKNGESYGSLYQLNFAHTNLINTPQQQSLHIGLMSIYDFAFYRTQGGYHLFGFEFGLGVGIPTQQNNQFDESSVLFNVDYGYVFSLDTISLYPYIRLEQYIFFPHKNGSADPRDYGLNMFLGLKIMQELSMLHWWANVGIFSDFNASGNGIGVLGDNTIVYDRDGLSNGVLGEGGLWIFTYKGLSLQARFSAAYALSYYEINLKSSVVGIWHF